MSNCLIPQQLRLASPLHLVLADAGPDMTLRMERIRMKRETRLRLIGELRHEQLNDVRTEIERGGPHVTLDLDELDLVDVDAIRFLNDCEAQNVKLVNCSAFIREWMFQEHKNETNSKRS